MDDEEQIGPISGEMILPTELQIISFLICVIGLAPIENSTMHRPNSAVPPPRARTIFHKRWI
jgi:hypothetical protein